MKHETNILWYNFFFKYILEIIEMVGAVKENAISKKTNMCEKGL